MNESTEKWLKMYLDKNVSKTEMYFIISLENNFEIKKISPKIILKVLMNDEITEINRFVKRNQGYSLNICNGSYILFTPRLYFEIFSKKDDILKFLNQELKLIKSD